MVVKIFYKDDCPLCPKAKELKKDLHLRKIPCQSYDVNTVDGLAEASFYGILSVPSVIIEDEEEIISEWKGNVPDLTKILETVRP